MFDAHAHADGCRRVLAGGLLVLLGSIVQPVIVLLLPHAWFPTEASQFMVAVWIGLGGIVSGGMLVLTADYGRLHPSPDEHWNRYAVVAALLALVALGGLLVGPLFALSGAARARNARERHVARPAA